MADINFTVRVKDSLKELGKTPDEIAEHLHNLGIIGKLSDCCMCPVARFLARRYPEYVVTVDRDTIAMLSGDHEYELSTPAAIDDFIDAFDEGDYPNLIMS